MSQRWWKRGGGFLLDQELDALKAAELDFEIDEGELARGHVVLRGHAPAGQLGEVELAIVYPGTFPDTRPAVFQVNGPRLARHQNPFNGNYCLIGRSSDYWFPGMTAAALVARLPHLVELVTDGGDALREEEDPQGEPVTTYFKTAPNGCVIVPDAFRTLPENVQHGQITVVFRSTPAFVEAPLRGKGPTCGQGLLVEVTDGDGGPLIQAPAELRDRYTGARLTGTWTRVPEGDLPPTNWLDLARHYETVHPAAVKSSGKTRKKAKLDIHAFVFNEEVRQGEFEPHPLFLARCFMRGDRGAFELRSAMAVAGHVYGPETLAERIRPVRSLAEASVSIVGLGTLGAPLAGLLAQAQIGRLDVADYDTVDPNTTVRWPGGLDAARTLKTAVLARDIATAHPFVDVVPHALRVGLPHVSVMGDGEVYSDADAIDIWSEQADLVIDATAEDNVSRAVAGLATRRGLAQLFVWGVDGYGGVVALIRPGETGCFHCMSIALANGKIEPPPAAQDSDSVRVQPRGCDDPTFIATAPDMLPLANQAARVAMSYLSRGDADGYGALGNDVHILAMRRPDGSPLTAPEWRSYDLPVSPHCGTYYHPQ